MTRILAATVALAIGVAEAVAEIEIADEAMLEDARVALEEIREDERIVEEMAEEETELDTDFLVTELERGVDDGLETKLTEVLLVAKLDAMDD